ncbi:MAG TPA: hypothetical protein PKN64_08105, partial [Casimicrobium sp.]|nr:hypothetical protein [Casimicrobium sp.]
MEFEAWWLLIPLGCFALGWFAARVDIRYVLREARALPSAYFRGLNFLLREQHDKAVESFVDVSRRDPHALDLQLALGSLFRRQGRIGEATGIHQSLVDRHDLPKEKRDLAQFELAQDFHAAGLFDRAETVYEQLTGTAYEAEAVMKLASVLEQEKAWQKAIAARERVQRLSGEPQGKFIAQYHCELAETALALGDAKAVDQHLSAALAVNRNNSRVRLIAFRAAMKSNDTAAATAALVELQRTNPELLVLIAEDVEALYGKLTWKGAWMKQWVEPTRQSTPPYRRADDPVDLPWGNPTTRPRDEIAATFLIRMVHAHPGEITIIAGGPLTNL